MRSFLPAFGLIFFSLLTLLGYAQLPFGHDSAIYKDSTVFVEWASSCSVHRGLINIIDSTQGYSSDGDSSDALGMADGTGVVSLGDGGYATLSFTHPVINGSGYDFAVFENGFNYGIDSLFFLELGFVEVSSDGVNFFRFPSFSKTDTNNQIGNGDGLNPKNIKNLAGKFMVNYGTPFDLDEMKGVPGLDVNHVTHIRIIDVTGTLKDSFAQRDSFGRKINDPWPTPYSSCGFDLDAVGVIHAQALNSIESVNECCDIIRIYPNPLGNNRILKVLSDELVLKVGLFTHQGIHINMQPFVTGSLTWELGSVNPGLYMLKIQTPNGSFIQKLIINE